MKQFIQDNFSSMTFTFSAVVLLNAGLNMLQKNQSGMSNEFLLGLALLVLVLWGIRYLFSMLDVQSARHYHFVQYSTLIIVFLFIITGLDWVPLTWEAILLNGMVFSALYFITHRIRKHQVEKLAQAINQHLTENK